MVFVGFSVNSEVGSFVKSFELAIGLFHGAEFGSVPGAELVNEIEDVFQGARESSESERMELSMIALSSEEEGAESGGKAEDMRGYERESGSTDLMLR